MAQFGKRCGSNEQFGYPLSAERLAAIMRGEIAPLPLYAVDD